MKGRIKILMLFTLLFTLSGCRQVKYVPVYMTDSTTASHTDVERGRDTIIKERTTVIREADSALLAQLADMGYQIDNYKGVLFVLQNEITQKIRELERSKTDTVTKYKEVPTPYPVEKEVKKPLSKWQQWCMSFGRLAMLLCAAGLIYLCWRLWHKIKKN